MVDDLAPRSAHRKSGQLQRCDSCAAPKAKNCIGSGPAACRMRHARAREKAAPNFWPNTQINHVLPVTNRWNPAAEPTCPLVGILPVVIYRLHWCGDRQSSWSSSRLPMGVGHLWTGSTACATALRRQPWYSAWTVCNQAIQATVDRWAVDLRNCASTRGRATGCTSPGSHLTAASFSAAVQSGSKGPISKGRGDGWTRQEGIEAHEAAHARAAVSYDQWVRARLAADPDLSVEYLRQVLEQSETPEELLLGLRRVAEVLGMSRVAEVAGLSRESLYRSLSAAGNPRLSTLVAVLRVAGLRLSVRPAA